jgi:DNA invertase Pin-like site-specific DNA recombinase
MEAVRAGEVPQGSYLLLENLDRFSRFEPIEAMASFKRLCEMGVNVVTLYNERVFTAQLLRRDMMAIMELAFTFGRASEESEVKARRLKASWENKRAKADTKKLTARCPAWLSLDSDRNGFTVYQERAAIVQRIYGETLQGCSPHSIAYALNKEGVPVFGRGKHWHRSYIVKILDNASVIGTMTPHTIAHIGGKRTRSPEEPIEDYFPAIIEKAIYQRVQTMRATQSPMRGRHAGKEVNNIFAGGLIRCARCGGTLARLNKGKGTKGGVYLVCSRAKAGAGCEYEAVHYQQI